MGIYAGIDVGTQSTKLVVYDSGRKCVIATSQQAYGLTSRPDGSREQDAGQYTSAILACFAAIAPEVKQQIKAIGVSGQQHGFVPLDKDGKVIAPVKLWCDTSSSAECKILTETLGGKDRVFALIGNQILPGYTASKVLALKHHHPNIYSRLAHILLPHDYVNYFLTGRYVMECGDASGTAFFDIRKKEWCKEVLAAIDDKADWSSLLPSIIPSDSIIGTVTPGLAHILGIAGNVVVSAGGGDNMMAAIGTGCVSEGNLTVSMGTSGTLFGYSGSVIADEGGALAGFCSSTGGYLPLLCTMNCTVATEEVRKLFELDVKSLDELAGREPIGARGVTLLPYFNGERTPNYPRGRAVLGGFTTDNLTKGTIARASLESAVYSLRYGLDSFLSLGFHPKAIVLSGGGANSPLWRQMVADVFSLPVSVPEIKESAGLGAAIQALWATGEEGHDLSVIAMNHVKMDEKKGCNPDAEASAEYQKAYERFLAYSNALAPLFS